jgi:hypothetical protein
MSGVVKVRRENGMWLTSRPQRLPNLDCNVCAVCNKSALGTIKRNNCFLFARTAAAIGKMHEVFPSCLVSNVDEEPQPELMCNYRQIVKHTSTHVQLEQ